MTFDELITELESLSDNGFYKRNIIEKWLQNYELRYKYLKKDFDKLEKEFPNSSMRQHKLLINEGYFLNIYEVFIEILECYKNEPYFKEQVENYYQIGNNEEKIALWLKTNRDDEGNIRSKFKQLFQNTSKKSGFEFIICWSFLFPIAIKLDELDFKYTIETLHILKNYGNNWKNKTYK